KLVITGRTKLFINTFGEELMVENAEKALALTCKETGASVFEYTVAPVFMDTENRGAHQWLVEFEALPPNTADFVEKLDKNLMQVNSDYHAKRMDTGAMDPPQLVLMKKGSFYKWMAQNDKLGGQHKVPRLWNTRQYAEVLLKVNESI
ncbi:MAG TPA: GH3 auxin-responsive promoter family protein, partial [Bacteroidales bacterium]|nr:GH3 auxin-responsive promoter family protein [Bacteroidales bacterium]